MPQEGRIRLPLATNPLARHLVGDREVETSQDRGGHVGREHVPPHPGGIGRQRAVESPPRDRDRERPVLGGWRALERDQQVVAREPAGQRREPAEAGPDDVHARTCAARAAARAYPSPLVGDDRHSRPRHLGTSADTPRPQRRPEQAGNQVGGHRVGTLAHLLPGT